MSSRSLGVLSVILIALTVAWLVLLIWGIARMGAATTFEEVLAALPRQGTLFLLGYLNAALLTVVATIWLAGLYGLFKHEAAGWPLAALMFAPVYCTLNLVAYLSQVTVVPDLLSLRQDATTRIVGDALLHQWLQLWPGSAAAVVNNLGYAMLGIPSIIYGGLLVQRGGALRWGGVLLALNGVACIVGFAGIVAGSALIGQGSLLGGVLFLLALFPLSYGFLTVSENKRKRANHADAEVS